MSNARIKESEIPDLVARGLLPQEALIKPNEDLLALMEEQNTLPREEKPKPTKRRKEPLVESTFVPPWTWTIPFASVSEANGRDWRARSSRSGAAWKAVRATVKLWQLLELEKGLRDGRAVAALFTRLGGRKLDAMVNLPSAMKGLEDAFCYLLGVSDSSPQWRPRCNQEPGGPIGVRVELSFAAS